MDGRWLSNAHILIQGNQNYWVVILICSGTCTCSCSYPIDVNKCLSVLIVIIILETEKGAEETEKTAKEVG